MGLQRARPSHEILSGDSADVYFARAESILAREGLDPIVTMEVFTRQDAVLCGDRRGQEPARARAVLGRPVGDPARGARRRRRHRAQGGRPPDPSPVPPVRAVRDRLSSGCSPSRPAGRPPRASASTSRRPNPVISFGARHIHPDITDVLDYAAIVGGCVGASTPAGARLAGLAPTGTMPHSLVLIFGDTVEAAMAFDRHIGAGRARGSCSSTPSRTRPRRRCGSRTRSGDRLYGVRLDTPSERGRVTADLVHEVRARLDQAGLPAREDRRVAAG